jgi:hypothetical protein
MNKSEQYLQLNKDEKKVLFLESYFDKFNKYFGITIEILSSYYDESIHSGYPIEPSGSIWEMEGKSIYCFIRCLKPKKILEIGNYKGRSSNHILQAVEKNGFGEVHLVDIAEYLEYDKLHNKNFTRTLQDSIQYLNNPLDFDCYVHDGCHEYIHVKKELELITSNTKNDFHIWSHDYFKVVVPQCEVKRAWDEFDYKFEDFLPMIDKYSDCGFLIAKYKK